MENKKNFWVDIDRRKEKPIILWKFKDDRTAVCMGLTLEEIDYLKERLKEFDKRKPTDGQSEE